MNRRDAVRLGAMGVLAAFVPGDGREWSWRRQALDVRSYGAVGDGMHDDTQAFQAAVDALPTAGGTVHAPPGRYLIRPASGVRLRSHLRLELAEGATLVGMPSAHRGEALLVGRSVTDVTITGGQLVGSVAGGTPPREGVASFGALLRDCAAVRLERVQASGFGMDAVYVGARGADGGGWLECRDIALHACAIERCRRQGVSVTSCTGFRMTECDVHHIGPDLPGSGVDLEPNPDRTVADAEVRGCSFHDNHGFGVMVGRTGVNGLVVADNDIRACGRGGILVKASLDAHVVNNRISASDPAISVRGRTAGVLLERNRCTGGGIEVVRPASADQLANQC